MIRRIGQMPAEEIFSRNLFGIVMILATFISWGKWITFTLGILFLLSAFQGVCWTCLFYKKFFQKTS